IGKAAGRERGEISGVAVSLKKKKYKVVSIIVGCGGQDTCRPSSGWRRRSVSCAVTTLADSRVLSCRGVAGQYVFFSSRRRHTRLVSDWTSDVCSSDLLKGLSQQIVDQAECFAPGSYALMP